MQAQLIALVVLSSGEMSEMRVMIGVMEGGRSIKMYCHSF
jgi:hypothetical protein